MPIAPSAIQATPTIAPWYRPPESAHFPATKPPRPIPRKVAMRPGMGARTPRATTVTTVATATPARTARQRSGGGVRGSMRGKSSEARARCAGNKTDPRGLRGSVGSRKVPRPRNEKRDAIASQSDLLLLRGLLRSLLLLGGHSDHLLLATRCSVYRHRHVANVNT